MELTGNLIQTGGEQLSVRSKSVKMSISEKRQEERFLVLSELFPNELDVYEQFLKEADIRETSKSFYRSTLKLFNNWFLSENLVLAEIGREHIIKYKDGLIKKGLSSLTVAGYLSGVKSFFKWISLKADATIKDVTVGIKLPERSAVHKKFPLRVNEAKSLLQHVKENGTKRDYAIINLIIRTGLRTIEVIRADIDDIKLRNDIRILKVHGKGKSSKDAFVKLTDEAYKPISDYLQERKASGIKEPLFVSASNNNHKQRLTTRTISSICKRYLRAIGLDSREYTAHSLRHTAANLILDAGGRIEDVQAVLRHSNISTSMIYLEARKEERRLNDETGENLISKLI